MIHLRNSRTGETVIVNSRDGYPTKEGWRKLPGTPSRPRHPAAKRVGGKWLIDREEARRIAIRGMDPVELFDFFDKRIKDLEAQLAEVKRGNS